ncbi:MAG: non-homologous end joining protein Ku [Rhodoplanes sp.]
MAPRANWKGYLKLSLVSCAVALFPATSTSQRVRFNILSRKTGHRVRYEVVDAETNDPVPDEDRVKGYKVEDNAYVFVEEEELDKVALESTHTIDIESFVPRSEVDAVYLDAPYYLVPDDRIAQEAFAVIRDAMQKEDMVGLARVVLNRRERILMIEPRGKGLLATTLHYKNEIRKDAVYFEDIPDSKITPDMLELAVHIVDTKTAHFDPAKFEDRYEQALAELIQSKRAGETIVAKPAPQPSNVVNLMDALRRSVQSERGPSGGKAGKDAKEAKTGKASAPAAGRGKSAGKDGAPAKRKRMKKAG